MRTCSERLATECDQLIKVTVAAQKLNIKLIKALWADLTTSSEKKPSHAALGKGRCIKVVTVRSMGAGARKCFTTTNHSLSAL